MTGIIRNQDHDFQGMSPVEYVIRFSPLVRSLARRYTGRGADFDDLVEDGYVSLLQLGDNCPGAEPITRYLVRRLPGRMRDSAARYRKEALPLSIDAMEDQGREIMDDRDLESYISTELFLYGLPIDREEFLLAEDLIAGMTQNEIAEDLGVSQQTISYRLIKLREMLKKLLNLDEEDLDSISAIRIKKEITIKRRDEKDKRGKSHEKR